MAAKLFTAQTWLSVACAMLLFLIFNRKDTAVGVQSTHSAMKFIVSGLLLALLVEFGVSPRIISARFDGGNLKVWHALGSGMYLLQWLSAGLVLWLISRNAPSNKTD